MGLWLARFRVTGEGQRLDVEFNEVSLRGETGRACHGNGAAPEKNGS